MGRSVACGFQAGILNEMRTVKNFPGSRSVVPYTISAAVVEISSFSAVRIPRSTSGGAFIHEEGLD